MRKQHFFIILFFCLAAIAFSGRHYGATTWAGTASNQMVTRAALLDAVNNGVFTANATIPNDGQPVTRERAQQYVNIQTISGYSMNQLVPKSAFVAATVYYAQGVKYQCGFYDGFYNFRGWASSSSTLSDYGSGSDGEVFTLYNRSFQVGDEIFSSTSGNYPTVYNGDIPIGGCSSGTFGYWFYSTALNAAIHVTNTNTGRQYVIDIVYPSGTTNVTICLIVDIAGSTATVQAQASTAVNTDVSVDWNYTINGIESLGSPFTISNGNTTSSVVNINNGSTINSMTITINGFSPSSNGTQNYISGGQCN